tara:strand:+ start:683 stop:1048 length:366 start_codon:yes stop_codon:yes gene_type:complete
MRRLSSESFATRARTRVAVQVSQDCFTNGSFVKAFVGRQGGGQGPNIARQVCGSRAALAPAACEGLYVRPNGEEYGPALSELAHVLELDAQPRASANAIPLEALQQILAARAPGALRRVGV